MEGGWWLWGYERLTMVVMVVIGLWEVNSGDGYRAMGGRSGVDNVVLSNMPCTDSRRRKISVEGLDSILVLISQKSSSLQAPNLSAEAPIQANLNGHVYSLIINNKSLSYIGWSPPPPGWFKLNLDGSSLGSPGLLGAGGLIHNHFGEWVVGYAWKLGLANSLAAELWG
ncbi:hypothetical protein ACH5RR_007010 [Cinchona calisaya]|uniref:RNase H type-1 domain-containing protein n=1 Tax=Cinchona calisaya TaxID=153742 RepID=A0ABD3AQJ4_9GENT